MAKAKILIVEDEIIVAEEIHSRLEGLGYVVSAMASSGEEAIKKAEETHPDLVLMDIKLPGDIDGVEAAAQIRDRFDIPVVYLTAYADEDTLQRAKIAEPFGYLVKPFQERELYGTMEMALYKHKMQKRVKESQRWYCTILKSIDDGIITADARGLVICMNPIAEAWTGLKEKEAIGKELTELFDIIDGETGKVIENSVAKALREGVSVGREDHILITRDGREIAISDSASLIRDDKGNITDVVFTFSDITDRKRAEEALREARDYLENLIDCASAPIVVWNVEGRITLFNAAFERLTGYRAEEVIGQPLMAIFDGRQEAESLRKIEQTLRNQCWEGVEIHVSCKDGQECILLWNSANIYAPDGKTLVATIAQGQDVTERKRMEDQLKASLSEKEVLLKEIHHRVKNNLQIICSMLYLQSRHVENRQVLEMLSESQHRVKSMALVHEQLYQSKDLVKIDFAKYVPNLVAYLSHSYGVSADLIVVKTNIKDVLLEIDIAIPCALIINELVSNSLKYAFPAGREGGEIHVDLCSDCKGKFTLMVSDNGVGFPKDLDFQNTKSFGLRLVNMLVRQLNGAIELDRNRGTTFRVTFALPKH